MAQHTSDEGVYLVWEAISILEQITDKWYDHSASENLYVRKLHYERKRTAGYSFWPMGGWEQAVEARWPSAFESLGGTSYQPQTVERALVAGRPHHRRACCAIRRRRMRRGEVLEADQVIVNAPVWDLPKLFDDGVLPWNLLQRIKMLANNRNKACWLGYWIAAKEPVIAMLRARDGLVLRHAAHGPAADSR